MQLKNKKEMKTKKIKWITEGYFNQPTNPINWPGERGKAVKVPENKREEATRRFRENQFNVVASEMIALNRSIGDHRHPKYLNLILVSYKAL